MDYRFKKPAKRNLEELDEEKAREILASIEEVAEKGLEHKDLKLIQDRKDNWLYRLKVTGKRTNHRVFMDYSNQEFKILDILHRREAYEEKYGNK